MYILLKIQNNCATVIDYSEKEDKKYLEQKMEKVKKEEMKKAILIKKSLSKDIFICENDNGEIVLQILKV